VNHSAPRETEALAGRPMLRFVLALFAAAALMTTILGGWSLAGYARMLAWSSLVCWIVAGLIALVARLARPAVDAAGWPRFFFLAGMPLFAASALLEWVAGAG
jgi:hypothetical protein